MCYCKVSLYSNIVKYNCKYYADQRFIGQLIARGEDSCRHYTRLHIATDITRVATEDGQDTDDDKDTYDDDDAHQL